MNVYEEVTSLVLNLTAEQVDKLINLLPELISQVEESEPVYPQVG